MSSTTSVPAQPGWRGEPLTMGQLGRVLLAHWVLLIVLTVVGGAAGFAAAKVVQPVYTASATMLVKAVPGTTSQANYEAAQYAVARARAYPTMLYNISVLEGIRSDLGTSESLVDLRDDLSATAIAETPLVQVVAQGSTAEDARDKANAALRRLSRFVVSIETINGRSPISVDVAVAAGSPGRPTSPRPLLYIALGAVSGFAFAVVVSLLHGYVRSVRPRRRASRELGEGAGRDQPAWEDADREHPAASSGSAGEDRPTRMSPQQS